MNPEKLIEGINFELESLEILFSDIINFPIQLVGRTVTKYDKAAVALMISQFFNGIENIFKRILDYNSIKIPKNEQFHIDIINAFSEKSKYNLELIFPPNVIDGFSILRRFRHYVFHGYSFNLEWERLSIAIESLSLLFSSLKVHLNKFTNYIQP